FLEAWGSMRLFRACMFFMCALLCAQSFAQSPPLDPTKLTRLENAQATVTATFKSYNRVTKESLYDLQLKNVSGSALHGPLYVTIEGVSVAGITVKNPSGVTTNGAPYFVMSSADM